MADNYKISFEPAGVVVTIDDPGMTVMQVAAHHDIALRADCGGRGYCGKCRVVIVPPSAVTCAAGTELTHLSAIQIEQGQRLACQTRIREDLRVTIPETSAPDIEWSEKASLPTQHAPQPLVKRLLIPKPPARNRAGATYASLESWLIERTRIACGEDIRIREPDVLRQMSMPGQCENEITLVNHEKRGITAVLSGHHPRSLGLAFDLGTTTLAAYLCDMASGKILAGASIANPQRRFGEDVISRIAHANESTSGLLELHNLIIDGMNALVDRCLFVARADREDIDEVTAAGNTTMQQICAGLNPYNLGFSPYLPTIRRFPDLTAAQLGLNLNPATNVHLLPVVSAFVGGDAMGAALAGDILSGDEICLIIDMGTNGEVVLRSDSGLWATSCATGPALEGAQISCGMRAVSGAIHKVEIDASGHIHYHILGETGVTPLGICGSGIIDVMAVLRRIGAIETNGRLNPLANGVICDERGLGKKVVLIPGETPGSGPEIAITLKDVRQFQLAKAALATGIELLMRRAGVKKIDRTVLTGAFGVGFNWQNAAAVGLLPAGLCSTQVVAMNNLAGAGAVMVLLNLTRRAEVDQISQAIQHVELAGDPEFTWTFAKATEFPEWGIGKPIQNITP